MRRGAVFKRVESPYRPGRRSKDWVKTKHLRYDELIVGGVTRALGADR